MILKAAPSIRNTYLSGRYVPCSQGSYTVLENIQESQKNSKETGSSQGVSWVGWNGYSRIFQQGELRVLMENAKGETQLLECEPS